MGGLDYAIRKMDHVFLITAGSSKFYYRIVVGGGGGIGFVGREMLAYHTVLGRIVAWTRPMEISSRL